MCHHSYATILSADSLKYTHHFSDHITFLIPVVITHIMIFLTIHTPYPWIAHLWTIQTAVSYLHMVFSKQGPFQYEMGTLQYTFSPLLFTLSPSYFLFLHSSTSGMHKWEAPGWVKRGSRKDQDWLENCQSPFSHREIPGLSRRGISTSNFMKYKHAFVSTVTLPFFSLLPLSQQLMPKVLSRDAFWERYWIPFTCSSHHIRSPARNRPDKINTSPRHLH